MINLIKPKLDIKEKLNVIVSLTTFPARVDKVWLTIESILYQSHKPDKIFLWLYDGEFNEKNNLPKKLLALEKRGLEIRFCDENLIPHKKYFYSMQKFPKANLITIDDDMFYPPNLIKELLDSHCQYPSAIICPITRRITLKNCFRVAPYEEWTLVRENTLPQMNLLTMGGGGTLFPPNSLSVKEAYNVNEIRNSALKADDLWLKTMSLLKGTPVVSLAGKFNYSYIPVIHKNRSRLMEENIKGGNNDVVFANLIKKYDIKIEMFEN